MNDFTIQNIINNYIDTHIDEIVGRLRLHMKDPANLELVPYDPARHRGLLMLFIHEGVHKIVDVQPESLLESILIREQEVMDRVNAAAQAAEDLTQLITTQEDSRALAESRRRIAEEERAAAELLRAAEEGRRVTAENGRQSQEQTRQDQETARQTAEQSRSSWYSTFRSAVERWYSSPNDGTGIKERWETFKSSADSWDSLKRAAWDTFFGATPDSEGGVRKLWSTFYSSAVSLWNQLSQNASAATQTALDAAAVAEQKGNTAESQGNAAEIQGNVAESKGNTAEEQGEIAEGRGNAAMAQGNIAEQKGQTAFNQASEAAAAEQQRQANYATLIQNMQALYQQMLIRANHPAQFGADGYIYEYDLTTEQYVKTQHFWQKLERFRISKEFASIAAMKAYDPADLPQGEEPLEIFDFVLIKSTVDDPDNSKLYSYMGENEDNDPDFERWHYLGDFSGAMGFEGKTPQFSIGTVVPGGPGTQPSVSITANGTDANGNPCFLLNFSIPRGDPGRGIASLEQTRRSSESEGENIWKAILTDGTEKTFVVLNGQRGHQGRALTYDDLTGAQKMELAGLARDYRLNSEPKTTTIVTGAVTPVSMVLKVPGSISLRNKVRQFIRPHLYPSTVPQDVIYQPVSGTSAVVNPSGEIFALEVGESVLWVVPVQNTGLWRQVSINVRGPRIRLTSSGKMRRNNSRIRIV